MSDFIKPYLKSGFKKTSSYIPDYLKRGGGLTEAEQQTLPYLDRELEKQEQKKSMFTPLQFVFDLLSMPNAVIANTVQDIGENKPLDKVLEGALKSATLQRKGSWKTTLFGGQDEGEEIAGKGLFPNQAWAKGKIPILGDIPIVKNLVGTWEDAIGLIGDIVLDPTTYMTFGLKSGATAANKAAARAYAKEAMKRSLFNQGNLDELAKIAGKGFNQSTLMDLAGRNMGKAQKYLEKHVSSKSLARFNEKLYNQTFKEALSMTGGEAVEKLSQGLAEGGSELIEKATAQFAKEGTKRLKSRVNKLVSLNPGNEYLMNLQKAVKGAAEMPEAQIKAFYKEIIESGAETGLKTGGVLGNVLDRYGQFSSQLAQYGSPEFAKEFAMLGERKVADFFGKELGKGIRKPNVVARSSERLKQLIGKSPIGTFGAALATKLDNGIVGKIKSALNIRNPYQDMLSQMKMDNHYYADMLIRDEIDNVEKVFGKISEDDLATVRDIIDLGKTKGLKGDLSLLTDPDVSKKLAASRTDPKKIAELIRQERSLVQDWAIKEGELAKKGLLYGYTPIADYLPHRGQVMSKKVATRELGTFRPGFTKHQELSLDVIAKQDQAVIKFFLGVDDAAAKKITEMGWSTANMSLKEMLMYRAHAHARAMATADMAEKFAQFGIKADAMSAGADVVKGLSRAGENAFSGLRQIQTEIPALKGMFFDEDVANILDRVIPVVSTDKGMGMIRKAMSYLTTMFKGYATLSPGFHLRNDRSNMFTGFVNYGAGFLNPARKLDGMVVSAYGLYGADGLKKLTDKLGVGEYAVNKILNKEIGGKTYKQWADEVLKPHGVVSKASMGYGLEESIEKMGKKDPLIKRLNPLSKDNAYFKGSREIGGVIESSARAQGFLIDIEKMAGKGGQATKGMVDEAVRNVKKYFFDYEDLSEVEKRLLKPIIPFYSWVRKNIALQMDQLVRKPGTMGAVAKTLDAAKDEGYDEEDLPDWVRGQGGIMMDGKVTFPDLPFKDLNQIPLLIDMEGGVPIPKLQPQEAWDNFLSMAHPVFKTVTTLSGEGWDPFKKQSLDASAPAPRAFRLLAKNPQVFQFLDAAFRSVGIENGLGIEVDKASGKIKMDAQAAKLLEDNFILLRRLDDMGDVITTVFPQIEDALEKATDTKNQKDAAQRAMRTMSFALGISQRDIDLDQQAEFEFRDALRRAEDARRKDMKKTPGAQSRSQEYYKRAQNRMRRMRSAAGR